MGSGWRRALCTTFSREQQDQKQHKKKSSSASNSPRSCTRLSFFSGGLSNPSTPRLHKPHDTLLLRRTRTESDTNSLEKTTTTTTVVSEAPKLLQCIKTTTPPKKTGLLGSNPTSPRSPLKLSIFKNSFKFRSSCGICLSSVKTGQGTAIYTAECSHAFHFPCIAAHVRKHGSLVCPVCSASWKDVPLLAIHKITGETDRQREPSLGSPVKPKIEEKKVVVAETNYSNSSSKSNSPSPSPRATKTSGSGDDLSANLRCYDDDEPLLSASANAKISPIPEADEDGGDGDEEDDVEEFQGFFVNPNPSCSSKFSDEAANRNNVQVRLLPEAAVVSVSSSHQTYAVALRVKAPPPAAASARSAGARQHRAPVDLVAVLDASGSMTGAKLLMMKRAMRLVISSLGAADRLSIVSFSAAPKRQLPLRLMTPQGQRAARRIVDRLVCGGQGSCVGEALRKATKVLEDRRERNPVASVILLSDGQDDGVHHSGHSSHPNQRHSAASHVSSSSTRFAHIEIPVHAFGLGKSRGSGGGYKFSHQHHHAPAEDAFAKCVGGLLSVVVQDLRIQLGFTAGDAEISAVYSTSLGRPTALGAGSIRIGDLYAEEERELLVEVRVPTSAAGAHRVMSVRCLYKDPATKEVVYGREQGIIVPPAAAVRAPAPKIERLRNVFLTARAVAESRRLVDGGGDWASAHQLLASARALVMQSSLESAEECARGLEAELAELHWRRQQVQAEAQSMIQRRRTGERDLTVVDENGDPLTPTSAWRAAEKLAKVAMMKKSMNRVSDLHGFENARF